MTSSMATFTKTDYISQGIGASPRQRYYVVTLNLKICSATVTATLSVAFLDVPKDAPPGFILLIVRVPYDTRDSVSPAYKLGHHHRQGPR